MFGSNNLTNTFGAIAPTSTVNTASFFGTNNLSTRKPRSIFSQRVLTNTFGQSNGTTNYQTFVYYILAN